MYLGGDSCLFCLRGVVHPSSQWFLWITVILRWRHGHFYLFCCVLLSACVLECLLTMPPTALITGLSQSRRKLDKGPRGKMYPQLVHPNSGISSIVQSFLRLSATSFYPSVIFFYHMKGGQWYFILGQVLSEWIVEKILYWQAINQCI